MKKSLIAAIVICLLAQPVSGAFAEENLPVTVEQTVETEMPEEQPTEKSTEPTAETPEEQPTEKSTEPTAETPVEQPTEKSTEPTVETPVEQPTEKSTEPTVETPVEQPTTEPTAAPTEEPAILLPVVSDKKEIPEMAEAWMRAENGFAYGTLEELIACAQPGGELFLHVETAMRLKEAPVLKLSELKFSLDEDVFKGDEWKITYLQDDPEKIDEPRELDAKTFKDAQEDLVMEMFIRVDSTHVDPEPTEEPTIQIEVSVDEYRAGEWSPVLPTFTLSGKPDEEGYSYAVVIYDERIAVLSEDVYAAEKEGVYTVRFAILNAKGDIVSASDRYTLLLDETLPEVSAMVDESMDYTLRMSASDALSGVKEFSTDGGQTWTPFADGEEWVYTAQSKVTVAPGTLQVRDAAGNTWQNDEEYVLDKIPSFPGGGGGGGGGDGKKKPDHAAGDKKDEPDYDTVELQFPEEPMTTLQMGETELPLTLELADPGDFQKPADYEAKFSAALRAWPKPAEYDADGNLIPPEENPAPDTLVLTAMEEDNMGDRFEYRWKVNGEVFRLLENSGIQYLVFNVNDNYAVFPTAGFTGGTEYTTLRMNGFSIKKFDYTISMSVNLDPDHIPALSETDLSVDCDIAVLVQADGRKYVMSAEQKGEMYFYDVTLGPAEMLEAPYGTYTAGLTQIEDGRTVE